jgi:protein TonB
LLVEGLLVMMLLTLGAPIQKAKEVALSVFNLSPDSDADDPAETESPASPAETPPTETPPADRQPDPAEDVPPPVETPSALPPPVINLTTKQMATADVRRVPTPTPAPAKKKVYGPPAPPASSSGDTPRVEGSGPNGEPLYAASWYREPYDDELRGYLSTASGPGWGLIMCRTVANFRVEDCVGLGEYPQGSNIMRAVLAAAWQFRVRPPQIGGRPQVGEWVRIRIDYMQRR